MSKSTATQEHKHHNQNCEPHPRKNQTGTCNKEESEITGNQLTHMFEFCEEVFNEGNEILILVTELTINYYTAMFISRYGCKKYFEHNKELLFYERQKEIIAQINDMNLEA